MVYSRCEVVKDEHLDNGVLIELFADSEMENRLEKFTVIKEV